MNFCVFICIYAEFFVPLQRILCVHVHAHYEHDKKLYRERKTYYHLHPHGAGRRRDGFEPRAVALR